MESKPKEEKNKKPKLNKKDKKVIDKKICEKCLENSSKIYNRNKFCLISALI